MSEPRDLGRGAVASAYFENYFQKIKPLAIKNKNTCRKHMHTELLMINIKN